MVKGNDLTSVSYTVTVREYCDYKFDITAFSLESLKSQLAERLDSLDCDDMEAGEYSIKSVEINHVDKLELLPEPKKEVCLKLPVISM